MSKPKTTSRPTWAEPDYDPKERMIPEGSEEGYPTVRYDPEKGCNFHLDGLRQRCYHEAPPDPLTVAAVLAAETSWVAPEPP